MKRPLTLFFVVLGLGLITGCAILQTKEPEPPPLPSIEETKPPVKLKVKAEYFKEFPWSELGKASKEGNDPDTRTYSVREGDTFDAIAENEMGDSTMGPRLASYNDMSDTSKPSVGTKIVIPNPIIGMNSEMEVKKKGEREFGPPQPFDADLRNGDAYKLRFEPNVNGYCYVFRVSPKGAEMLYPAPAPPTRRARRGRTPVRSEPAVRETPKVMAHQSILVPAGAKGFPYDQKRAGDRIFVFFSMRQISELESLREKAKLREEDIASVGQGNEGAVVTEGSIRVLRVSDPADVLRFTLNLNG